MGIMLKVARGYLLMEGLYFEKLVLMVSLQAPVAFVFWVYLKSFCVYSCSYKNLASSRFWVLLPLFSVFIHKVTLAAVPFQIFFFQLHKKKSFFPKYHFCMHLSVLHGSSLAKFAFSHSFFTNYNIFLFLPIFMY